MRRGGRAAVLTLVVSLVVLVSVAAVGLRGRGGERPGLPADVGSLGDVEPRPRVTTDAAARSRPAVVPSGGRKARPAVGAAAPAAAVPSAPRVGAVAGVEVHDARVGEQRLDRVVPPVRIQVPTLGVDAPVRSMGIEPSGEMELPVDPDVAGWYGYGPTPGEAGSSVVAGHVDGGGRPGAFFRLGQLRPGQRVTVVAGDGSTRGFRVVARRTFTKARLPASLIFRRTGPPVLTLITCGGEFDRRTRHYDSNVVVFATPI